ncbi:NAD(P)-dependent oxidoreductase [Defluviimonas aestuarii]|uniref:NAD(P)-dependent oxidoreductase n=1 Tax=Albidovulum aestuarii TaxID=1130726 RepID=UPI00249A0486|nr:NAD(P)-dependent oxidoreductase [Defluviimonas aestuarii]MDI3338809.1 NAD(P)-dependent oxidoreductase [Defluviimonas aestuarii]
MKIGFVGLGRMGAHMAHNLVRAGHDVSVWNRSSGKADTFGRATGCAVAATPRALSETSDIVVTMLADDASSEAVHLGTEGLFAGRARTFIEMGTMSPEHIHSLADAAPDGAIVIDAPVSGATQAAEAAELMIMAGCSETVAAPMMPVFEAMGRRVICLGRRGAGSVMKLAVNSLIHGLNQTLAEAMTLAEAAGITPETAFDAIEASAAAAPMLKYRRPLYLDEAAHDVTFTVSLARKDMEVTATLARSLGTPMPQGMVTLQTLQEAEAAGFAPRDMASILAYMREIKT